VIHYHHSDLWDVNICGVRGTWSANGNPKKVTCRRCRRHLTYWVLREMGLSKALKRRHRRQAKAGKPRHRLTAGRTGSVRHKQRRGMLNERKRHD